MNSIITAKSKLPIYFIQDLYNEYGNRMADKILSGMLEERYTTLRVNSLKTSKENVANALRKLGVQFEEVSFINNAFIIKNKTEEQIQESDIYKDGQIYLQSLSSMLPPIILNPTENDKVLDLTAAPGSKTTQMACMMKNNGYILANEVDKIRCERLKYNVNLQGAKIVEISNNDGRNIGKNLQEKFDKVLLDVPCSGEGRFLVNRQNTYSNWSEKQVIELSNLQKELFESGYKALKSSGTMVYSTCTLNKMENENIIDWAIKKYDIEIVETNIKINEIIKPFSKGLDKNVEKAIKILPSKNMEGFFVCLIKKKS